MSRLARASALRFSTKIIESVGGALATLYFARVLGASVLGQYFLALAVTNWLLILPTGVRTATTKRISEGDERNKLYSAGTATTALLLVLFAGAVVIFREYLHGYLGGSLAVLVAVLVIGKGWTFFSIDILRGEDRVELATFLEGGWTLLRAAVQVAFVLYGLAVIGLLAGEAIAAVVIAVVCLLFVSLSLVRPSWEDFRDIYEYARYSWFGNVKVMSYSWMDTIVLGYFVTRSTIGVYETAWRVSALFILLPTAISNVIFPTISRKSAEGDFESIEKIIGSVFTFAPLVAIPGTVGAFIIGDHVLAIYGEEFAGGMVFLALLSVARIAESIESVGIQLLNALDYPNRAFRVGIMFTTLNIVLNVVLIAFFGAIGAGIATTLSMVSGAMLAIYSLPSDVSVSFSLRDLSAQIVSALVMGGVVFLLDRSRPPQSDFETVAYVVAGALIYGIGVFLLSATFRQRVRDALE